MTSSRDPKAVGIAPAALSEFIADLKSRVDSGYPQLNTYKSAFSACGISTGNITQIERVLKWVTDQMPMLQRRQSLAEQVGAEKFDLQGSVPMVTAGAGVLDGFKSPDDAKRAGKEDAKSALAALKSGRDLNDVLGRLGTNALDPDYMEAFYRLLGASGIRALSLALSKIRHDDHQAAQHVIGRSLATASHRIRIDNKWLNQLAPNLGIAVGEGPATLAPFLKYGNFDKEWLKLLGAHAVSGNVRSGATQEIWQALAKNPRASTEFYYDHFPEIQQYIGLHGSGRSEDVANAFANVVRAATIDGRKVDRWRAEFNATVTIDFWKNHPNDHTVNAIRKTYADLAAEYWPDLVYSVTSPVKEATSTDNPFRQGIELPPDAWRPFLKEAMRDPGSAARLLALHKLWQEETRRKRIFGTPDPRNPSDWDGPSIGMMRDFMHGSYDDLYNELAKTDEAKKWNGSVQSSIKDVAKWALDKGLEKVIIPEATEIKFAVDMSKIIAGWGLDQLFGDEKDKSPNIPQQAQFTGTAAWQENAREALALLLESRVCQVVTSMDVTHIRLRFREAGVAISLLAIVSAGCSHGESTQQQRQHADITRQRAIMDFRGYSAALSSPASNLGGAGGYLRCAGNEIRYLIQSRVAFDKMTAERNLTDISHLLERYGWHRRDGGTVLDFWMIKDRNSFHFQGYRSVDHARTWLYGPCVNVGSKVARELADPQRSLEQFPGSARAGGKNPSPSPAHS